MNNPFEVLGLNQDASLDEVKRAYKELAKKYHPDHNPGYVDDANEKMKLINEAYDQLVKMLGSSNNEEASAEEIHAEKAPAEETPVEEAPAEEAPVEETSVSEVPVEETPAEEKPAEAEPAKDGQGIPKKMIAIVVAVFLVIALVAGLLATSFTAPQKEDADSTAVTTPADGNPGDETCKGTYTVTDEEAIANRETVVATMGDYQLTNGELQVYYWSYVTNYLNSEFGYNAMYSGALNYAQGLDTQWSLEDESLTWQQYFLKEALLMWQSSQGLAAEAAANGMAISDDHLAVVEAMPADLQEMAEGYGFETVDELLLRNVGAGAGLEEFVRYQKLYYEGLPFYEQECEKIQVTQEQVEAFYEAHAEEYVMGGVTKDEMFVDVRHILVFPEGGTTDENGTTTYTEEEWAECEKNANALLKEFEKGQRTEENFALMANEYSEDGGSNTNGGLYTNVYKGQMVENFENWCFDESRKPGDYGLVRTEYGYHLMFFVRSYPMWQYYAEADAVNELRYGIREDVMEKYPMEVSYGDITLGYVNLAG